MLKVLILNILFALHPVHVTLTTINQAPNSDSLNVSFRMYFDDFQLDFNQYYPEIKPGKNNDSTDYPRELLDKYFNDRVRISINKKLLTGILTDISINEYEILLNLIYQSYTKPRNITVRNSILTTIYNDQANMVYLSINKYEDAFKLTVGKDEETIKLK